MDASCVRLLLLERGRVFHISKKDQEPPAIALSRWFGTDLEPYI